MKKIAFLLNRFPLKSETFIINQILNAHNAGYEIRIFPQILENLEDASLPEIIEHYGLMDKVIKPIPFRFYRLKRIKCLLTTLHNGPPKLLRYLIKSLNLFRFGIPGISLFVFHKIVQFQGNLGFDIFHCQYGPNGLIAAWLKELGLLDGKIITTFHGFDAHFKDPYFMNYYYSPTRIWSPLVFKHSDLITVNTPYLLRQLVILGADPNKIELLPMGVDTSFFLPNENRRKQENIQLLSVGRLVKWKGHELGIQVVDNDIFLMTSVRDNSGKREAQGIVTVEAQACGLPVVAFRSGGVPYTIEEGKTGYLAEEKNVRNLPIISEDYALMRS